MEWHLKFPDATPSRSHHPPDIPIGYEGWLEAFWELGTERQIGFSMGPIPSSAIAAWCKDWAHKDRFHAIMRALDAAYMKWHSGDKKPARKVSAMPMSEKLFDRIWG